MPCPPHPSGPLLSQRRCRSQHHDGRNPRGADDAIDQGSSIPGEMQVRAKAGSVFIQDSRLWHSTAQNPSDAPRTSIVARYW